MTPAFSRPGGKSRSVKIFASAKCTNNSKMEGALPVWIQEKAEL